MFLSGTYSNFIVFWFSQIEILQESRMMIPDCQRRLEVAHAELTQLLVSIASHTPTDEEVLQFLDKQL